jgi:hypothetical protein
MKELTKLKKKKVVFEKLNASAFVEFPDGYYFQQDSYNQGYQGSDYYLRGGNPGSEDEILF